jgi:hypothetical protein
MNCYICAKRGGYPTQQGGLCSVCQRWVCVTPSSRPDGKVHGDNCACGCDVLVCQSHHIKHSATHSEVVPSPCFARFSIGVADDAARASAGLLHEDPRFSVDDLDRFLRVVAPGVEALFNATIPPGAAFVLERKHAGREMPPFRPELFSRVRIARVAALSIRAIEDAARLLRVPTGNAAADELLSSLPDRGGRGGIAQALIDMWALRQYDVPDPMRIPDTALAIARWLLRDDDGGSRCESLNCGIAADFELYSYV